MDEKPQVAERRLRIGGEIIGWLLFFALFDAMTFLFVSLAGCFLFGLVAMGGGPILPLLLCVATAMLMGFLFVLLLHASDALSPADRESRSPSALTEVAMFPGTTPDAGRPARKLISIASYDTPFEAHLARVRLESEGIRAAVEHEYFAGYYWHYNPALGGVKITVPCEHAVRAYGIITTPDPIEDNGEPYHTGRGRKLVGQVFIWVFTIVFMLFPLLIVLGQLGLIALCSRRRPTE